MPWIHALYGSLLLYSLLLYSLRVCAEAQLAVSVVLNVLRVGTVQALALCMRCFYYWELLQPVSLCLLDFRMFLKR